MNREKLRSKAWYPTAAALCIAVVLYVVLMRLGTVWGFVRRFLDFFSPVFLGCLIAYLINPLAQLYRRRVFQRSSEGKRAKLSNLLAFITVVAFLVLMILVILPQLVDSVTTFADQLDGYVAAAEGMMDRWGLSERLGLNSDSLLDSSKNILDTIANYVMNNLSKIINSSATAGKHLFQFVIGFILSIYLLAEKEKLQAGAGRLFRTLVRGRHYEGLVSFLRHCDGILRRYIVFNLLDSLIVGVINGIFMIATRMPYMGLVSVVVAVTNLIPTIGPAIGAVIGAFVLVLVKPWHAVAFLAFTLVLQTFDGYILKPRLFGNSLGVSGLWILIGVIVGGRMFGILGILAAIPAVAILDYVYRELLLPWLERRRLARDREESNL